MTVGPNQGVAIGVTLALGASVVVVWALAEGVGYFSLSKAMTMSEYDLSVDLSQEILTGERLFETSALVLDSVITCTPPRFVVPVPVRALSWESVVTTPPCSSRASRRLSREFRLG